MKGKGCGISLVLMAALTAACARPTPEPAFQTEPCPDLDPDQRETLDPTFWTERLEKLPTIPMSISVPTPVKPSAANARGFTTNGKSEGQATSP